MHSPLTVWFVWRCIPVVLGLWPAAAHTQARFSHTAILEGTLRQIGGIGGLSRATDAQVTTLAVNFVERGQFLLDLYEFTRVVVRDHARFRDSISRKGGGESRAARAFLGRSLQEMGRAREATTAYRSVGSAAPLAIRTLASAWSTTILGGGTGWEQQLTEWRRGKAAKAAACPPTARACALFQAILANDAERMVRLQSELHRDLPPDYVETVVTPSGPVALEFHDPLGVYLLSVSDFAMAALVLKDVERGLPLRGEALLRAGRWDEAEATLRAVVARGRPNASSVWLGESLYRLGKRGDAEQAWLGADAALGNVVADARAAVGGDSSAILAQLRSEVARGFGRRFERGGDYGSHLGRALLRLGRGPEALEVLRSVRPPSDGTDLNDVRPDILILVSHARYLVGHLPGQRENFPNAKADLAAVANTFPVAAPTLKLMQQVVAPPNFSRIR